jgi:hypothetical protein
VYLYPVPKLARSVPRETLSSSRPPKNGREQHVDLIVIVRKHTRSKFIFATVQVQVHTTLFEQSYLPVLYYYYTVYFTYYNKYILLSTVHLQADSLLYVRVYNRTIHSLRFERCRQQNNARTTQPLPPQSTQHPNSSSTFNRVSFLTFHQQF